MVKLPFHTTMARASARTARPAILALLAACLCGCIHGPLEKGEACLSVGDYQNAILFFQRAVDDDPGSYRSRRGLALSLLQKCGSLESEGAATAEDWKSASRAAHYALLIHDDTGLRSQEAVAEVNAAKRIEARGDTISALRWALQAAALQPRDIRAIDYAAVLSYRTGNAAAARDLFWQATIIDSCDAVAFFNIGMLYWYSHETLRAYDWWLKALKRSPADTVIVYWVAKAESEMKRMTGKK